jgi:hypothetical protein
MEFLPRMVPFLAEHTTVPLLIEAPGEGGPGTVILYRSGRQSSHMWDDALIFGFFGNRR